MLSHWNVTITSGHACTHHAIHSSAPILRRVIHVLLSAGGQQRPQAISGLRSCCTCCCACTRYCAWCCCTWSSAWSSFCTCCHNCAALGFTSGTTRPRRGSEASKLKFPVDVPDMVKSVIANFVPSDGQFLANVNHRSPSLIHYWGVRLGTKPEEEWEFSNNKPKERAQLWICLGDDRCRNAMRAIKITNKQTSSATTHLDTQHKVKSARTTVAEPNQVNSNTWYTT